MAPETKNQNNTKNDSIVSAPKKTIPRKKPEKSGLLKRVLYWIAKGGSSRIRVERRAQPDKSRISDSPQVGGVRENTTD